MENTQKMIDDAKAFIKNHWSRYPDDTLVKAVTQNHVYSGYLAGRRAQAEDDADLLAACKDASDLVDLWLDESDDPPFRETEGFNMAIQCKIQFIKAAIAKAKG